MTDGLLEHTANSELFIHSCRRSIQAQSLVAALESANHAAVEIELLITKLVVELDKDQA